MDSSVEPRRVDRIHRESIRFSICTFVTSHSEYAEMVRSFREGGFDGPDCEYLYLDNSERNAFDAFVGGNIFLREAAGIYIILCHQDVLLHEDKRTDLEARLKELDALHSNWALCGNGGGTESGELVIRVTDPHGVNQSRGTFPARITALDENFIVVRRDANLSLSHDLSGFHLYGADLCILADVLGRTAWVIDFHLHHKSPGKVDRAFDAALRAIEKKYRRAFRSRKIQTTCARFSLGNSALNRFLRRRS
jgi:hypothetical protein